MWRAIAGEEQRKHKENSSRIFSLFNSISLMAFKKNLDVSVISQLVSYLIGVMTKMYSSNNWGISQSYDMVPLIIGLIKIYTLFVACFI